MLRPSSFPGATRSRVASRRLLVSRMFSERSHFSHDENPLFAAVRNRRDQNLPVIDLTETNPFAVGLAPLPDWFELTPSDCMAHAPNPLGDIQGRLAVSQYYRDAFSVEVDPDDIVLTASTSEAYVRLFHVLADRDQEVATFVPGYPLLDELADESGIDVLKIPLDRINERWVVDGRRTFDAISERTRAVVLVRPNHPTGTVAQIDELLLLSELELPLIIDEVFVDTCEAKTVLCSSEFVESKPLKVVLGGIAKTLLLPNWKLSWMVLSGNAPEKAELKHRLEHLFDRTLSLASPVLHASSRWFARVHLVQRRLSERLAINEARLRALTSSRGDLVVPPRDGGWHVSIRWEDRQRRYPDDVLATELVERFGLLTSPGYLFEYPEHECWLVLSLLAEPSVFAEGAECLVRFLAR